MCEAIYFFIIFNPIVYYCPDDLMLIATVFFNLKISAKLNYFINNQQKIKH